MKIIPAAHAYCAKRGVARTLIFNVSRYAKLIEDCELSEITPDTLNQFIAEADIVGLSRSSIHGTLKDLRTLVRDAGLQVEFPVVQKSKIPLNPPTNQMIEAIWPFMEPWLRQNVAVTWYCAARLADVIRMQIEGFDTTSTAIRWTAAKTEIQHIAPLPEWMEQWLQPVKHPFTSNNDWSQCLVRRSIAAACALSKTDVILPKEIRQAGYEAWTAAGGWAGKVLHDGKVEGVMGNYISPMAILNPVVPKLKPPVCMRGEVQVTSEGMLLNSFRLLDDSGQGLLVGMAEKLAGS